MRDSCQYSCLLRCSAGSDDEAADEEDDEEASDRRKKRGAAGKAGGKSRAKSPGAAAAGSKRRRGEAAAAAGDDADAEAPADAEPADSRAPKPLRVIVGHQHQGEAVAARMAELRAAAEDAEVSWDDAGAEVLRCEVTGRAFHRGAALVKPRGGGKRAEPRGASGVSIAVRPGDFVLVPVAHAFAALPGDANDGHAHLPRADRACPWMPPAPARAAATTVPVNDPVEAIRSHAGTGLSRCDAAEPEPFPAAAFASAVDIVVADEEAANATPERLQARTAIGVWRGCCCSRISLSLCLALPAGGSLPAREPRRRRQGAEQHARGHAPELPL